MLYKIKKTKNNKLSKYLSLKFNEKIKIIELFELGEGCHGLAFKAISENGETFILKQFKKEGRNMEFIEDRIREAHLINRTGNLLNSHVKIHNICYFNETEILDLPLEEPIIVMEEILDKDYFNDLFEISKKDKLTKVDKIRILNIAKYLANIHSNKMSEKYYLRYLKDWYSFGILELTNELREHLGEDKIYLLKKLFLDFEHKLYLEKNRCANIHGEFFPGTIHFDNKNNLKTYDMRRIGAGEPADDVGSILFNFLAFPLQTNKKITPLFLEASKLFLNRYLEETYDFEILNILPVFMAYRCLILAHPNLVPMDNESRKLIQEFLFDLLKMKKFSFENLKSLKKYLQ